MKKLEVIQRVQSSKKVAEVMVDMVTKFKTADKIAEQLEDEFPEDVLKHLITSAQKGNYPLSLDGLQ